MAEIDLGEGHEIPVALRLRTVRGRPAPAAPFLIEGHVAVGAPNIRHLTPADAGPDEELARFIATEAVRWDYYLVALSCTFVSREEASLASGWLRITLSGEDTTAHSMEPVLLEEITNLPYSINLVVPLVIKSEFTINGAHARRHKAVESLYEGTRKPSWLFHGTDKRPVHGVQRLRLVVRTAAGRATEGVIEAGASVRQRRLGMDLFSYTTSLTDLPAPMRVRFDHS
ncbi:hypothetical protein ACH4UT_23315 [Streptomyces sp. NPDC020799]|uniref:hypothetical protein n=1 Tax=Streptomyces sp. NPDC020799 TaxID=3365091 RepID=UPI00379435B0